MNIRASLRSVTIFALFLAGASSAAQSPYIWAVTDSMHTYSYNAGAASYDFAGVTYNYYSQGLLDSAVTTNGSRIAVSRTLYSYDSGNLSGVLTLNLTNGIWVPSQNQVFTYDPEGFLAERVVTKWTSGQWQNLNRFTYEYNEYNLLLVYSREMWRNGSWTDFSADSLFYDEEYRLIERSARLKPSGVFVTRTLYEYDSNGQKLYQVRQDFINNQWINVSRINSLYDKCRIQSGTLNDAWDGTDWKASARSTVFYHFAYDMSSLPSKIPVCHNGTTIMIKKTVLPTHLAHGDCPFECFDSKGNTIPGDDFNVKAEMDPLFKVYPNPASERLTVSLNTIDCPVSKIELLDLSGRVLRMVSQVDESEVTIDLNGLREGNYVLRITSEEVYSTIITKR